MGQDPPNLQSVVRSGFIPRAQKAPKGVKQAGQDGARAGQDRMHLRKHLWTAFQRRTEKNLPPGDMELFRGSPIRGEAQVPQACEWLRAHELFKTRGGIGSRLKTLQIPN